MSLNETFLVEVARNCDFLCSHYGAVCKSESQEWLARVTYVGADFEVIFSYGDRELCFGIIVGRRISGRPGMSPFALWEWLDALNVRGRHVEEILLDTPEKLSLAASRAASVVHERLPMILTATSEVVLRMEGARTMREQVAAEADAKWRHSVAADRAAVAFREGNFKLVVSLLEPLEQRLSPAETRKLQLARTRVGRR